MAFSLKAAKAAFFDTEKVRKATDRGTRKALSKFGAFVRQRDKSSLKYKTGKADAGNPPHVHRNSGFTRTKKNRAGAESKQKASPLRELTLFAYDEVRRSVLIGAAAFRSPVGEGLIPRTVEEGGTGPFLSRGKIKQGVFKPHPHLGPAFRAELPKAPQMFKDIIR